MGVPLLSSTTVALNTGVPSSSRTRPLDRPSAAASKGLQRRQKEDAH